MVKRKKSENTESAVGAGAPALTETPVVNSAPISSNLAPSKNIKKDGKKVEGASDVLINPTPNADPNSSKEEKKEKDAGFIFVCNARTKPECYKHGVFGMPKGKSDLAEKIKPGTWLFLYDFNSRLMHGIYKAVSKGGTNFVPAAFGGAFPDQVKFKIEKECLPLPESNFRNAITENYVSPTKFEQGLNSTQVNKLVALFQPITAGPQPAPTQVADARHAHRPLYLPPPSDLDPPAHLPPPEDPYRTKMHLAPAHLLSSVEAYHTHAPVHESICLPSHAPRPVNDHYNPAHYLHAPFSGLQPSGPQPPSYLYQAEAELAGFETSSDLYRAEAELAYYESQIPSDRVREYFQSLVAAIPRAVDDPYEPRLLTSNSSITNLDPQHQLLASYIQRLRQRIRPYLHRLQAATCDNRGSAPS